mgnify:CR=1 FL=1
MSTLAKRRSQGGQSATKLSKRSSRINQSNQICSKKFLVVSHLRLCKSNFTWAKYSRKGTMRRAISMIGAHPPTGMTKASLQLHLWAKTKIWMQALLACTTFRSLSANQEAVRLTCSLRWAFLLKREEKGLSRILGSHTLQKRHILSSKCPNRRFIQLKMCRTEKAHFNYKVFNSFWSTFLL